MDICLCVKKKIVRSLALICLLIVLLPVQLGAQAVLPEEDKIDLNIGLNLNYSSGFNRIYSDIYKSALAPGLFANLIVHQRPRISYGVGLEFNGLNYTREATDTFQLFRQVMREYYLDIPFALYYYPGTAERNWNFYLGLTPSLLLNKYVSQKENNLATSIEPDPSKVGRIDLSIHAGGSIKLNDRFFVKASYAYSVTSKQNQFYNSGRFSTLNIGLGIELTKPNKKESAHVQSLDNSIEKFRRKNLILLVRLKTEHKKIASLRAMGYEQDAKDLEEEVQIENESTITAFRNEFHVCEVLYFYDTLSKEIAKEDYSHLMDRHGVIVDTLVHDSMDVLIAEFGSPYSEAFQSSSGFGLVVYDYTFKQMEEPFPFYISNFYGILSRQEVVRKFNKRFTEYLKSR